MKETTRRRRRWPAAIGVAAAALAIGAVAGGPLTGEAATKAAPTNSGTPTISGTPEEGSTLTAGAGTWTGSPTSYAYAWERCDQNGNACASIAGATATTYQLAQADVGHTLRVTVTATNADGAGQATSVPTAAVSSAAAPTATTAPSISGTVQVGSTLTVSDGAWSGNPTSLAYGWMRCDATGANCSTIVGATAHTYQLAQVDVGATLRATVTATNSAGSTKATTVPTAAVPAPVVSGCPSGTGALQVTALSPPARLAIDEQTITPGIVSPAVTSVAVRVRATACGGRPVQGATVFVTPIPYNQFTVGQGTTGTDGTLTVTLTQRSGFPADRRQRVLAVFVRATKPGEPVLGGISTRRLVTFPVSLHR